MMDFGEFTVIFPFSVIETNFYVIYKEHTVTHEQLEQEAQLLQRNKQRVSYACHSRLAN